MLVFATEFPTKSNASASDFLNVCKEWLIGSPRYPWDSTDFPDPTAENAIHSISKDEFEASLAIAKTDEASTGAMQHRYRDRGELEWVTELVGREHDGRLLVSVRLHCTALVTGAEIPWARKPYVVRQAIEKFGGGADGGLTVQNTPILLSDDDLELAASAINGELGNALPVIYVSVGLDGKNPIDTQSIALRLSGMAHVLVEPSRGFSFRLMPRVDRENAYGGAIGIYWPGGGSFDKTFVGSRGAEATQRFLESRVQAALCQAQPTDFSTWMGVRAVIAHARIDQLREGGEKSIDEWIDAFEEERKSLRGQLAEANARLASALAQNRASRTVVAGGNLLPVGSEQDLFPGERAEIVQHALKTARAAAGDASRSAHVLEDLILGEQIEMRSSLADSVKNLLQDKMKIGANELAELSALGFKVSDDGKHYKAVFREDPRYTFTLHKTASDHRAPKNLVGQINRVLFK